MEDNNEVDIVANDNPDSLEIIEDDDDEGLNDPTSRCMRKVVLLLCRSTRSGEMSRCRTTS